MTERKTKYDYSKLYGKIKNGNYTQKEFAKLVGMSETSLNLSLNNKRYFRQDEMANIIHVLNAQDNDVYSFFYKVEVESSNLFARSNKSPAPLGAGLSFCTKLWQSSKNSAISLPLFLRNFQDFDCFYLFLVNGVCVIVCYIHFRMTH